MRRLQLVACLAVLLSLVVICPCSVEASIETIDLVYEFGGQLPVESYGTIKLADAASGVDVTIMANTVNLGGGDIHELYFNLPAAFNLATFTLSNFGGVSDESIGTFSLLGPNPSVVGGAGASFDWGVDFGDGAGPSGNGTLTEATFNIDTDIGLSVSDFLAGGLSTPNNLPSGVPGVLMAVHFQATNLSGVSRYTTENSETVGGALNSVPEPTGLLVWLGLGSLGFGAIKLRRCRLR